MGLIIEHFKPPKLPLLFHIGIGEGYPSNTIKTTSYNLLTFLPSMIVATLVQFKRLANIYFLVTAILQFIPAITSLSPVSTVLPLVFVITISLLRMAVEEIGKFKFDREANSHPSLVYCEEEENEQQSKKKGSSKKNKQWKYYRSDQLKIGNIIKVLNNERLPADIILLASCNENGKAYIETSSLDGEKDLKIRTVLSSTQTLYGSVETISKIAENKPLVTLQEVNQNIYSFNAVIQYLNMLVKNNQSVVGLAEKNLQTSSKDIKVCELLKINQFLYRDSVLRNTEYIIGVVAYTGKYTKSMMNSAADGYKMSQIQKKVNFYLVFIFILQVCLLFLCGLLHIILFYRTELGNRYTSIILRSPIRNYAIEGILTACSYFILLNTMIPISLLVTVEIVKYAQGFFISYDKLMAQKRIINKREETIRAKVWRSSINEELGMVKYVLTDKTGTLTKNEMKLKKLVIGNALYHNDNENSGNGKNLNSQNYYTNEKLQKQSYSESLTSFTTKFLEPLNSHILKLEQWQKLKFSRQQLFKKSMILDDQNMMNTLMMINMAICHECILLNNVKGVGVYCGSSADEVVFVDSASRIGYKFVEHCYNKVKIVIDRTHQLTNLSEIKNNCLQFGVQHIFEFNSNRKRMSIILSHPLIPKHKILLCKGADDMIDKFLRKQYKNKTDNEGESRNNKSEHNKQYEHYLSVQKMVTEWSRAGLRTLVFGYKFIKNQEYEMIRKQIVGCAETESNAQGETRQSLIIALQQNLFLCGASGVEDKLQDGVQSVIEDLVKANIKVCMLTGDKMETAENIAKSCQLFQNQWQIIKIEEGSSDVDIFKGYCDCKNYLQAKKKYGIVVEGSSISNVVNSLYFLEMFEKCSAAVCCRITPKNKAEVVNFVKHKLKQLVLAIGDGANDVPMIQAANIGIGIYGNEGMNAVQASDFAIPQFQSLWRLLFVHGRWNYIRIAELVKYYFYKNFVFTMGQLWFASLCQFSGTSIYDATYLALFNIVFTAGPVFVRALLQQDLNYVQIIQQVQMESKLEFHGKTKSSKRREKLKNFSQMKTLKMTPNDKLRYEQFQSLKAISLISSVELEKSEMTSIRNYKKQHSKDDSEEDQSDQRGYKKKIPQSITKVQIDKNMKYLFPLLYTHSQQQLSLTPKTLVLLAIQSIMQSLCIFSTIYFGVKEQCLWIFSICLYTSIFAIITIRICYDITYWTWIMVFALLMTSIIPYLIFIYAITFFQVPLSGTFLYLLTLPNFYFCCWLAIGIGAIIQGVFSVMNKYYFPTTVDFVRKEWKKMHSAQLQQKKKLKSEKKVKENKLQSKQRSIIESRNSSSKSQQQWVKQSLLQCNHCSEKSIEMKSFFKSEFPVSFSSFEKKNEK